MPGFSPDLAPDLAYTLGEFSDLPGFWCPICAAANLAPDFLEHGEK